MFALGTTFLFSQLYTDIIFLPSAFITTLLVSGSKVFGNFKINEEIFDYFDNSWLLPQKTKNLYFPNK